MVLLLKNQVVICPSEERANDMTINKLKTEILFIVTYFTNQHFAYITPC